MGWDNFEESFIHTDDHKVMGYRLLPFSLYHQFILEAIGSPVVSGDQPLTVIDLEIVCRICSSGYMQYKQAARKVGFFRKLAFAAKVATTDFHEEVKKFDRYFGDYVAMPETFAQEHASKNGKVYQKFPAPLSIVALLMSKGFEGGNREKIWMTPLGEAHWFSAAFLRQEGAELKLITEHDREYIEGFKRMRAEAALKAQKDEQKDGQNDDLTGTT